MDLIQPVALACQANLWPCGARGNNPERQTERKQRSLTPDTIRDPHPVH